MAAGFECVALQETRVRRKADGSNPLIMSGAYKVLFSGVAKIGEGPRLRGVGIALRKNYNILWSACPTDRLACLCTKFGDLTVAIISAYAPTEVNTALNEKQKFYEDLISLLKMYQENIKTNS